METIDDPTGSITNVYGGDLGSTVIDKQLWLQYMFPQGDRLISISRHLSDGSIHVYAYQIGKDSNGREQEYGNPVSVVAHNNGVEIRALQ